MQNKYEALIEHIINDNEEAARELFHQIVVAKSRDIYESLMDEEMGGNPADQYVQDVTTEIDQDEQGIGEDDEEGAELELGGDDEMDGDEEEFGDEEFGDEEGEGDVEDRVMDLEQELDALKAEFDKLLAGEEAEEHDHPGIHDMGGEDMGAEEPGMDMGSEEEMMEASGSGSGKSGSGKSGSGKSGSGMMEAAGKSGSGVSGSGKSGSGKSGSGKSGSGKSSAEIMKEYVDTVKQFYKGDNAEGSEVGAGGSVNVNKTSITDNMKNDMGGTTANIVKGGAEADPKSTPAAKTGGVLKQGGEHDVAKRNVNVPGGNKGAQDFYGTKAKAKPAEGSTTDGSVPVAKDSLLKARK